MNCASWGHGGEDLLCCSNITHSGVVVRCGWGVTVGESHRFRVDPTENYPSAAEERREMYEFGRNQYFLSPVA